MAYDRRIVDDLMKLGVTRSDVLLVHSSYKALGRPSLGPDAIINSILECIGSEGTLLMPALSYEQRPPNIHDSLHTPSNVGVIPERFRVAFEAIRSVHPTHSVCAVGKAAEELLADHELDRTPCGVHSPFRKLLFLDAKILMLGCGCRPLTAMHAVEEIIGTPYLFGEEREYTITNSAGTSFRAFYRDHGFLDVEQRYDRVVEILSPEGLCSGPVGNAESFLINTGNLYASAIDVLKRNRLFFVDKTTKSNQSADVPSEN